MTHAQIPPRPVPPRVDPRVPLAARQRQIDGDRAEESDRRTSAIDLWGYAAEMTLKAAYFSAFGFDEDAIIRVGELKNARYAGITTFGLDWGPGKYHDVRAWAELLVEYRSRPPGVAYPNADFGGLVKQQGRQIAAHWDPTLRYHRNSARRHEVEIVKGAARWLMDHSSTL